MGCLTEEVMKSIPIGVWRLVLVAHNESTLTANDGPKASWVQDGEQPILKKGAGWGCHRSDVICSTFGWLEHAGVQIEYGKNYDGFWTREMFIKQVTSKQLNQVTVCADSTGPKIKEKIIPEFWETSWPWISSPDHGGQLSEAWHLCFQCTADPGYEL